MLQTDRPHTDRPAHSPAASRLPVEPGQQSCPLGNIPADQLFQGRQEVLIAYKGETYRLRITKNRKLILTK